MNFSLSPVQSYLSNFWLSTFVPLQGSYLSLLLKSLILSSTMVLVALVIKFHVHEVQVSCFGWERSKECSLPYLSFDMLLHLCNTYERSSLFSIFCKFFWEHLRFLRICRCSFDTTRNYFTALHECKQCRRLANSINVAAWFANCAWSNGMCTLPTSGWHHFLLEIFRWGHGKCASR